MASLVFAQYQRSLQIFLRKNKKHLLFFLPLSLLGDFLRQTLAQARKDDEARKEPTEKEEEDLHLSDLQQSTFAESHLAAEACTQRPHQLPKEQNRQHEQPSILIVHIPVHIDELLSSNRQSAHKSHTDHCTNINKKTKQEITAYDQPKYTKTQVQKDNKVFF